MAPAFATSEIGGIVLNFNKEGTEHPPSRLATPALAIADIRPFCVKTSQLRLRSFECFGACYHESRLITVSRGGSL